MAYTPMEPTISVCPSGAARASTRAATSPFAPVRFSATTGCPTACCIRVAMARATMSDGPPATKGTRMVTSRLGQASAEDDGAAACCEKAGPPPAAARAAPARRWRRCIGRSSVLVAREDGGAARLRLITLPLVALLLFRRLACGVPRFAQGHEPRRQHLLD